MVDYLIFYLAIGILFEIFIRGILFLAKKFPQKNTISSPEQTFGSAIFSIMAWPMFVYFLIEGILSGVFRERRLKKQMKQIIRDSIQRLKAEKIRNGERMDRMNEFERRFIPWADEAVEEAFRNNKDR